MEGEKKFSPFLLDLPKCHKKWSGLAFVFHKLNYIK